MTRNITNKTSIENIDVIATKIDYIQRDVADIKQKLERDYVTQDEFKAKVDPISKIVYGMVGVVLLAVIGALVNFVVRTP